MLVRPDSWGWGIKFWWSFFTEINKGFPVRGIMKNGGTVYVSTLPCFFCYAIVQCMFLTIDAFCAGDCGTILPLHFTLIIWTGSGCQLLLLLLLLLLFSNFALTWDILRHFDLTTCHLLGLLGPELGRLDLHRAVSISIFSATRCSLLPGCPVAIGRWGSVIEEMRPSKAMQLCWRPCV